MGVRFFKSATALLLYLLLCAVAHAAGQPRAAVVLGYYPPATDVPDPIQTQRVFEAAKLFASGTVDTIVVTGGFTRGHISEARMLKIALVTLGVPPAAVVEEERSATTVENGLFTGRLFDSRGWNKNIILISQKIHLVRATPIFRDNGFKVREAPSDRPPAPGQYPAAPAPPPGDTADSLIIVYEPYTGDEPLEWPYPAMAKRLAAAASLMRNNPSRRAVVYSDWHTRGPIDPAEVMKIALATLGAKPENITAETHSRYGKLDWLAGKYGGSPALLIAPPGVSLDPKAWPDAKWLPWPEASE